MLAMLLCSIHDAAGGGRIIPLVPENGLCGGSAVAIRRKLVANCKGDGAISRGEASVAAGQRGGGLEAEGASQPGEGGSDERDTSGFPFRDVGMVDKPRRLRGGESCGTDNGDRGQGVPWGNVGRQQDDSEVKFKAKGG